MEFPPVENMAAHHRCTHYAVLGVAEDAPYSRIKHQYRSALLALHPDKLASQSNSPSQDLPSCFLRTQAAWDVLRDSESRAAYDSRLRALRVKSKVRDAAIISEDISLEEMSREAVAGEALVFYYPCRCGDYFSVSEKDLQKVGCSESCQQRENPNSESPVERMGPEAEQPSWGAIAFEREDRDCGSKDEDNIVSVKEVDKALVGGQAQKLLRIADSSKPNLLIVPCGSCSLHIRLHL